MFNPNDYNSNVNLPCNGASLQGNVPSGITGDTLPEMTNQLALVIQAQQAQKSLIAANKTVNRLYNDNVRLVNQFNQMKQALQAKQNVRKFVYDNTLNLHICIERNGHETPIGSINIKEVCIICCPNRTEPEELKVTYIINNNSKYQYLATIPYTQFKKRKLLSYFERFQKHPDCPKNYIDELLFSLICNCETISSITIPEKGGWYFDETEKAIYCTCDIFEDRKYEGLLSDSLRKTRIKDTSRPPETVWSDYLKILSDSPLLILLFVLRISSYYLEIFKSMGIDCKQAAIIETHSEEEASIAVSMLKTFDRPSDNTTSLADRKSVKKALNDTNDGVVVFRAPILADHINQCTPSLEMIQNDLCSATDSNGISRHIIAVISNYASQYMDSEYSLRIISDKRLPQCSSKILQEISEEFDSLLIEFLSEHYDLARNTVRKNFEAIKGREEFDSLTAFNMYKILVLSIFITMYFFDKDFDLSYWFSIIKNAVLSSNEYDIDYSQRIADEFSEVLNNMISTNKLNVITYSSGTMFNQEKSTLLYKSGILSFQPETIKDYILPEMRSVKNIDRFITIMKNCGYLYCTNKNKHPIDLYDKVGNPLRLHAYSFKSNILNKHNRGKLYYIDKEAYLIDPNADHSNFLTLAHTYNEFIIGKTVDMCDEENNHIYVTGQSGFGKTFCLSQLGAEYVRLNHRLVIFDSSDSFTKEALYKNLNKEFVDENFTFIDLENDGVPIDLFNIADYDTLPKRKNTLLGIMSASTEKLHVQQIATIKKIVSELLKKDDLSSIPFDDIMLELEVLVEAKDKYAPAVLNRFESIYEDINEIGMSNDTWHDLFKSSKPAIVISTSSEYNTTRHQLIDMMLASLYNYQCLNAEVSLDIMIDELHDQNLSDHGPIYKILKEGRKKHIAFIGATQAYHIKGDRVGDVMALADTKIILKPTDDSEDSIIKLLKYDKKKSQIFAHMERGDCIIKGNCYNTKVQRNCPIIINGKIIGVI